MKHLAIGFLILAFCLVVGMPSEAEIDPAKAEQSGYLMMVLVER